jgi:hypothetical protein
VRGRGSTLPRKIPRGPVRRVYRPEPPPVAPASSACTMSILKFLRQATAVLRDVVGRFRAPAANAPSAGGLFRVVPRRSLSGLFLQGAGMGFQHDIHAYPVALAGVAKGLQHGFFHAQSDFLRSLMNLLNQSAMVGTSVAKASYPKSLLRH